MTLNLLNKQVDNLAKAKRECNNPIPTYHNHFDQGNANTDKFYMETQDILINSTKEIRETLRKNKMMKAKEEIKSTRILRYLDCFNNKASNSFLLGDRKELTKFRFKATNDLLNTSRDTKRVLISYKYDENIMNENCPFCDVNIDTFEHRCFCNSKKTQIIRER